MFIERVRLPAGIPDRWPFTMPPVRHLAEEPLDFDRSVTFLVGENGSGKSTLIEALADAVKINAEGGKAGTRYSSTGEKTPLGSASQVICATHSPIIASTPEAEIIELGTHGCRRTEWEDLEIIDHWRRYLHNPQSYLRHFISAPEPRP
jgi:predicted ATPase